MYGWFSPGQEKIGGSTVYGTESGEEVIITEVSSNPTPSGRWHDYEFVGSNLTTPIRVHEKSKYLRVEDTIRMTKDMKWSLFE